MIERIDEQAAKIKRQRKTIGNLNERNRRLKRERDSLREAMIEYAEHASWRCAYRGRYPWDPECPCGLTKVCRELDLPIPLPHDPEARDEGG